jgi:hypothetical protein
VIVLCNIVEISSNEEIIKMGYDDYAGHYFIVFSVVDGCVSYLDPTKVGV